MPTYEYGCRACEARVEVVQSFHDDPLTVCPKCGGELRKIFRSVGIVFKGSGFYKTDSRAASTKSTEPAPSEKKSSDPVSSSNGESSSSPKTAEPTSSPTT